MKSQLFKIANALRGTGLTLCEAFKRAWKIIRLRASMLVKPTEFEYAKEDGTVRKAVGYYGEVHTPKTDTKPAPVLVTKYFDVDVNGWRSFRADRLIMG